MSKYTPRMQGAPERVTAESAKRLIRATDLQEEALAALAADPDAEIYHAMFRVENGGSDRSGFADAHLEAEALEAVQFVDTGYVGIVWGADANWVEDEVPDITAAVAMWLEQED
ncbi:MAG: hypothetical protein M1522_07545 [Actinobacteria bacterium]|nr:hypothetical protein [Actinomycetota bacterium]